MERLTKRKYNGIISTREETSGIICSSYCDTCLQGAGNCERIKEMIEKLTEYEDLEEQGLLLRLPCKVGDVLYQPTRDFVSEFEIKFIEVSVCNNLFFHTKLTKGINMTGEIFSEDKIDKTVFLTKEDAEAKLKEIEGSEGE